MTAPIADPQGNLAYACLPDRRRQMTEALEQPRRRLGSGSGYSAKVSSTYSDVVPKSAAACSETGKCDQEELDYIQKVIKTQMATQAKYPGVCAGGITAGDEELNDDIENEICEGMAATLATFTVSTSAFEAVTGDPRDEITLKFATCKSTLVPNPLAAQRKLFPYMFKPMPGGPMGPVGPELQGPVLQKADGPLKITDSKLIGTD